jgi:hypothetical protein
MARLSARLAAGLLLLLLAASPRADDKSDDKPDKSDDKAAAPAGTWKVLLPLLQDAGNRPLWLLEFKKKDSDWSGEVLATAPRWPKVTVENLTVTAEQLRFNLKADDLTLPCQVKLPKDSKATKLYGTASLRKQPLPIELQKTTLKTLDPFEELKDALAREPLGHEAVSMVMNLLRFAEAKKVKPAEVRTWAEKGVKSAELYGPGWQRDVILRIAEILTAEKGLEAVALQYARRAERMLEPKEEPAIQKRVLTVLAAALEASGKEADAKEVAARIAKLDFRIKPKKFAGRKGKSNRVALVELFTCAQLERCVAAGRAFDALGKTFKPSEVVVLQYHLHLPQPDPLTSPDSEARARFYDEAVRVTPTAIIDGRRVIRPAGGDEEAGERYESLVTAIESELETAAKAELKLAATRKDNKVTITAEVTKAAETGDDVRLRVVLVEEQVAYKGGNGLPVHRHVVRAMPGGEEGTVVKGKTLKKTFTVDLEELRKKLTAYLDAYNKKRPFPDKSRPLELKNLRVVAFVQNDKNGQVLQAVQAEVKAAE